jgi:hypothetical protein
MATCYRVVDQQYHYRAHDRDNHAVNVQARDARSSEQIKQKPTDESADNSKRNIEPKALALLVDDLARQSGPV